MRDSRESGRGDEGEVEKEERECEEGEDVGEAEERV
jgi:hypothetical protein